MNSRQKLKFYLTMAAVIFGIQFALARPDESPVITLGLGAACFVVTVLFLKLCDWIARP